MNHLTPDRRPERGMEAWEPRSKLERTWQILDTVQEIVKSREASAAEVSLAWLEAQPAVTSVFLGVRSTRQLAAKPWAAAVLLTPDETQRHTAVSAPVVADYPYGQAGVDQQHRAVSVDS